MNDNQAGTRVETTSHDFEGRRERLRKKIVEAGLPALLVSHAANRFYLSGFELHDPQCNESAGMLLVTATGRDWLMTDPRYLDAARRLWTEESNFIYTGQRNEKIREFLEGLGLGAIGFESRAMSVATYCDLKRSLSLRPTQGLVEELRLIKDPAEITALERSCTLNHVVMERVPGLMRPGMAEADLAWRLEQEFRTLGASELAFAPIVAADRNAALPHAIPGADTLKENGHVLVDMGGRYLDYNSDQTRTFWIGEKPSDRFRRTMDMVLEAQDAAIRIMRPGLEIKDAYLTARAVFEKYGEAANFTHALGHGIGLETHESPSLSSLAKGTLRPGMVVTVEPGLYYPDWGGIRWEYMVLVTGDGARVL